MVAKKNMRRNYFDIHSLIAKGTSDIRTWKLPIGDVLYRPISQLEAEEANAVMLSYIKDEFTKKYIFDLAEENNLEKVSDAVEKFETGEVEKITDFPIEINFAEMYKAMIEQAIYVVYLSIRDFTDNFDPQDLKKIDGIRDLADEILRISGNTVKTQDEVTLFR